MNNHKASCRILLPILTVLGLSACGGSSYSPPPPPPPPPPPDVTAPTVSALQAPTGSSLNRVVTIGVTATDNVGVAEVRFFVDGTQVATDASAPYSFDWDTAAETDGEHTLRADAVDAAGNVGQSAELVLTVANTIQIAVQMEGEQEVPAVNSAGSGAGDFTFNLVTGEITGEIVLSGIVATAAHVHDQFAGANGSVLIGLEQDPGNADRWVVPDASTLDADDVDRLLAGALYVNAHTDDNPGGEVRGQILPAGFALYFAALSGDQEVPRVVTMATGRAGITINEVTGSIVVQVAVTGLDDATQAHVHQAYAGVSGGVLIALQQDPMNDGRWFVEDGMLNAAGLEAFAAGRLYVNVHSPAHQPGEIRGQIVPDGIEIIVAELSGLQEVPAVDTLASGTASVTLDAAGSVVSIHVNTTGVDDASASHLHNAFGGVNGTVEFGLTQDGGNPAHWFAENQPLGEAQLGALLAGGTYVNVHTPANESGEIRAQVIPGDIHFAFGALEGRQEVPAVDSAAGGTFAVTVNPATGALVAHANTFGVDDATTAHIHQGVAGVSGSVVIGLTKDGGDPTHWSVTDAMLDAGMLDAFLSGLYYVNVHTPANGSGEIRGQVAPPPVEVLFSNLDSGQKVLPVDSAASGLAASTVNRETGAVTLHLRTVGADDATASHIHTGYAGQNGSVLIGLVKDEADAGHFSVTGALFDEAGLMDYLDGRLYVNLHTPANPSGEIRGQIVPRDIQVVLNDINGDQVVPPVVTEAAGIVSTTANLRNRSLAVFVNATGVDDATSAGVHLAGIGTNGDEILPLAQTPGNPGQWSGIDGGLDAETFLSYRAGRLYAQVATPDFPGGEIRGQVVPPDADAFDDIPPAVTLASPGAEVVGTVELSAEATDDRGVVSVSFFANGVLIDEDATAPYAIQWDSTTVSNGQVTLTATADDAAGNTGTSAEVVVTVNNATPVTLTQIQTQVFSPICSDCHSGPTSGNLPNGMNLSSRSASFAALVGVDSIQQPAIDRVVPGNPDGSYLIRKLEGGPNISGTQMPQGGALSQATIDMIRQWITDGALDN